jgi:cytochrome b involved in lipid metabolism
MSMNKSFFGALFLLILFLFLTGCSQQKAEANVGQQQQQSQEQKTPQEQAAAKTFTMEEIAQHSSKEDCWLLISGKVYDVTKNIPVHPGGAAILQGCGKDATTLFETRPMGSGTPHSEKAREYLAKTYIGDLKQ